MKISLITSLIIFIVILSFGYWIFLSHISSRVVDNIADSQYKNIILRRLNDTKSSFKANLRSNPNKLTNHTFYSNILNQLQRIYNMNLDHNFSFNSSTYSYNLHQQSHRHRPHSNSRHDTHHCQSHFPSDCPIYPYVKFWKKRFSPKDCFVSPAKHPLGLQANVSELKYLVFEPDRGGWNNIRMAAETAMMIAHASGRVLVMPPVAKWYLLDKNKNHHDESTFHKFFDFKKVMESLDIISMHRFIDEVAKPGYLKAPFTPDVQVSDNEKFWRYLERACFTFSWEPGRYFFTFDLKKINGQLSFGSCNKTQRMKLFASHDRQPIHYNERLHNEKAIFFPGDYRHTHRILTHFYSYIYWVDPKVERAYKRLVRDRLHYHDDIFCLAGRGVFALHREASHLMKKRIQPQTAYDPKTEGGNTSRDATYHALHIRRGDFQYSDTRLSAIEIWNNINHLLDPAVTKLLYISTDETDKAFFKPFANHFKLKFYHDIDPYIQQSGNHTNRNHIGMIEQIVCANAHTFVGTPFSTFTGYITRMRGYYRDGRYSRTFYTMPQHMYQLHQKPNLVGPFWAREFAVAHKEIDDDRISLRPS